MELSVIIRDRNDSQLEAAHDKVRVSFLLAEERLKSGRDPPSAVMAFALCHLAMTGCS